MRNVAVIRSDGTVVATYPIALGNLNSPVRDAEYFDLAKRSALEDKLITEAEASDVEFRFVD